MPKVVCPSPRRFLRVLLAALLFSPLPCQAEESCLWLNAATAGGILGGTVTVTVSGPSALPPDIHPANAKSGAGPMSANPSGASYGGNSMDDADCTFHRQPALTGELSIMVRTVSEPAKAFETYAAKCGAHATPLKAIGNEAVVCDLGTRGSRLSEHVVGRVRDRLFVIDLRAKNPLITQTLLREKSLATAEIVAGNLF